MPIIERKQAKNQPILPGLWMCPGWMPILHPSGLITPGQLGPTRRDFDWLLSALMTCKELAEARVSEDQTRRCKASRTHTRTSSCWGIPSVIQTIRPISFSMASIMASAALGGGTYKTEASGFDSRTA